MSNIHALSPNPKAYANYNLNKVQVETSLQLLEVAPNSYLQTDGSRFVVAGIPAPPAGSGFMEYTGISGISDKVTVGPYSLEDEPNGNSFVGAGSGVNVTLNVGQNNTGQGINTLHDLTTGIGNTVMGSGAGELITTGSNNTIQGYLTGALALTTGSNNTYIGSNSGGGIANAQNRTAIGYLVTNMNDNTVILGNTANTDISSLGTSTLGGVNPFASITLKSTGGTPSPLNFYEETQQSNTATGIWAGSQATTISYTRIGRLVTISFPDVLVTATTASQITFSANIPSQYLPATPTHMCFPISVADNGSDALGSIVLTDTGVITIYKAVSIANLTSTFTGSGVSGYHDFSISFTYNI